MNPISKCAAAQGISPSNSEENNSLVEAILAGDPNAINRFIEGNMALVTVKVEAFLAKWPQYAYLRDDLLSEGFLALTRAAHELGKEVETFNPQGLIGTAVNNALIDLVRKEKGVPLTKDIETSLLVDPISEIELKVDLQALCKGEKDRRIIEMREQGYSHDEIGREVNLCKGNVTRRLQALNARYAQQ